MPTATAAEIKEGIGYLVNRPDFRSKYKNIEGTLFNTLLADLKVWLEVNECGDLQEAKEDRKKLVAGVIKESFSTHFEFGKGKKIGGYTLHTLPNVAEALPTAPPQFIDLSASWSANKGKYNVVRRDVARVLGIDDKGHLSHGSNFSGQQTLRQIIENLLGGVQGDREQTRVRGLISQWYHFHA